MNMSEKKMPLDAAPAGSSEALSKCDGKIETRTQLNVSAYSKIMQFFDAGGNPVSNGGWGHECRFGIPSTKGITEITLFDAKGKPLRPGKHSGFCLSFICGDHFNKECSLPIRLTPDPIILNVVGVAKLVTYGEVQRVFDAEGNELVLNRGSDGYILFSVRADKKVLCKFFLTDARTLRTGPDGYAFVFFKYAPNGSLLSEKRFTATGQPL